MAGPYHPSLMERDWLPVTIAVVGLAVAAIAFVSGVVLWVRDRPVPRWLPALVAGSLGAGASVEVIGWAGSDPLQLALLVTVVAIPSLGAATAGRFALAGWYLAGAGVPALLWWGPFVAEDLVEAASYGDELLVWAAGALALSIAGLVGVLIGDRQPTPAPVPSVPPDEPDPSRAVSIAMTMIGEIRQGPIDLPNLVSFIAGILSGVAAWTFLTSIGTHPVLTALTSALAMALVATELYYHVWPHRLARAMATHAFVGSPEMKRFLAMDQGSVPTSAAAARRWLDAHPESDRNRWVRPEMLAWVGDLEAAYDAHARLPQDTDVERFEHASMQAFLDTISGEGADLEGLAAMAERVGTPESDERLRAVAAAALARSRDILARGGGDWKAPLLEAQQRIGPRSLGISRADTWWRRFRAVAILSVALALIPILPRIL
jgi:hypothetical protein